MGNTLIKLQLQTSSCNAIYKGSCVLFLRNHNPWTAGSKRQNGAKSCKFKNGLTMAWPATPSPVLVCVCATLTFAPLPCLDADLWKVFSKPASHSLKDPWNGLQGQLICWYTVNTHITQFHSNKIVFCIIRTIRFMWSILIMVHLKYDLDVMWGEWSAMLAVIVNWRHETASGPHNPLHVTAQVQLYTWQPLFTSLYFGLVTCNLSTSSVRQSVLCSAFRRHCLFNCSQVQGARVWHCQTH